eukprot:scaffold23885_cov14-Tisochrysis_lutea.AAC.1
MDVGERREGCHSKTCSVCSLQELATEVFSRTRLNVHPCTYDAFGMTIVEAASMGQSTPIGSD